MNTLDIEARLAQEYGYKPLPKELSEKYRQFYIDNLPWGFIISGSDTVLMVIAQIRLSMIGANIVNTRTLHKCMGGGLSA